MRCRKASVKDSQERKNMTFEQFQDEFLKWTIEKIEAKKEDGFPICPFARKARLQNKIQFINALSDRSVQLETFDKTNYEIGIAWLGDVCDMSLVEIELETLRKKHPDLLYFTSSTTSGHFAKNFTNCVFIQLYDDIMEKRKYLHSTKYYDSWPEDYYKLITG